MTEKDDPKLFWVSYLKNIRLISAKTMLLRDGEVEEDLLDGNICWLTSGNLVELLKITKDPIDFFNKDVDQESCNSSLRNSLPLAQFLRNNLKQNTVIEVFTSSCDYKERSKGDDHWFVLIGGMSSIYLIEYGHDDKQRMEEWELEKLIHWMIDMMHGQTPDRFTIKNQYNHTIKMFSYKRKLFHSKTIDSYIR